MDPAGWESTPAAALPKPMAIKGPEMEEPGRGLGCSSSWSRIVPSAHAGQAFQDVGMGGWMVESGPGSLERGQGLGHILLPSASPCFPGGHVWVVPRDAGVLHRLPRGAQGRDKAAFSSGT